MYKMKLLGLLLTSVTLCTLGSIPNNIKQTKEQNDARIIVKFKYSPKDHCTEDVVNYQNNAISLIRNQIAPTVELCDRYTTLINGILLKIPSSKVNLVRGLDFVSALDYDTLHHIEQQGDGGITIRKVVVGDKFDENISAQTMNVPSSSKEGEGILIGVLDSSFLLNHYDSKTQKTYTHETYSALDASVKTKYSSAAEINAIVAKEGFHGEAKDVSSLYFNSKVPFYYDYGGSVYKYEDYAKDANSIPDNDVFSSMSDHGLHVSSMAAGNSENYKGIAPKAQLALFKVFTEYFATPEEKKAGYSDSSGCFDSAIIKALEDAAALDCDVLNMSFGSDLNDFDDDSIVYKLLKELRNNGIWSNYAAGNAGKGYYEGISYGSWTSDMIDTGILSGSANDESVMTIAASQADREYYEQAIEINGKYVSYTDQVISSSLATYDPERRLTDFVTAGSVKDWVKVPNYGEAKDYQGLNVANKIAIVDRGVTTFAEKVEEASKQGAKAICIINNSSDAVSMSFGEDNEGKTITPSIPVALIAYEDRDIFEGNSGTLKLVTNVYVNNPTSGQSTSFTSDGPTYDYRIKPEISTPGQLVKGAVCENEAGDIICTATNTYDYFSGTSMAAPNYTGCVALLLSEHTKLESGKLVVDEDYVKSVNARTMSTATQLKDKYGADASVRIQGAGMVNVQAALNSKVYLESLDCPGKAKIELKNKDDVANGNINLSFFSHNEAEAKTYDATVKIYRPTIFRYQKSENSNESASIDNAELQAITNTLIKEVKTTVTIPQGKTTISLDTISLDEATKQYIDEHFDAACPIEGFVTLTKGDEKLSIPFLGYYGNVQDALAVEPFNFEKEDGKTYPSALVNNTMKILGLDKGDFSSDMAIGYFGNSFFGDEPAEDYVSPLSNWLYNTVPLTGIIGDNGLELKKIKANKDASGKYTIYTQNSATYNTIIVQQFVMRSVKDNDLTITKKSNNQVILEDHMFDTLWGEEDNHTLAKSFCVDTLLSNGIIGHRAYTILGLFDTKTKKPYEEGEYEIKFDYELMDGSHQIKVYDLVINNSAPTISSVNAKDEKGSNLRIRFNSVGIDSVTAGSSNALQTVKQDELGYYVDINESLGKNGRIYFECNNYVNRNIRSVTHFNDPDRLTLSNLALSSAHDFAVSKETVGQKTSYTLTYKKNNSNTNLNGDKFVTINVPEGYDPHDVTVIIYDKDNNPRETLFTVSNQSIYFELDNKVNQNSRFDIVLGSTISSLNSISVSAPNKTVYGLNEKIDFSDLLVIGQYENNLTREICQYDVNEVDTSSVGEKTVTVSYKGKTATFNIQVVEEKVASLTISQLPFKTSYVIGDKLDLEGLVLKSITNLGNTADVTNYQVSAVDMSTTGAKIVTLSNGDFSVSFVIYVFETLPFSVATSSTSSSVPSTSSNIDASSQGASSSSSGKSSSGCGGDIAVSLSLIVLTSVIGAGFIFTKSKKEE